MYSLREKEEFMTSFCPYFGLEESTAYRFKSRLFLPFHRQYVKGVKTLPLPFKFFVHFDQFSNSKLYLL